MYINELYFSMTAKLQLLCTQMWRRILIPTKFSRCTVLNKVRWGNLYVCKQIYYRKHMHMDHMLWYTKDQLVAERRLPKVQTRLINDYLHFHNIYDGLPDPEQLPLILSHNMNLLVPVYVLPPKFWSTRPTFMMEKLASLDQEIQYTIGKIDPG